MEDTEQEDEFLDTKTEEIEEIVQIRDLPSFPEQPL